MWWNYIVSNEIAWCNLAEEMGRVSNTYFIVGIEVCEILDTCYILAFFST